MIYPLFFWKIIFWLKPNYKKINYITIELKFRGQSTKFRFGNPIIIFVSLIFLFRVASFFLLLILLLFLCLSIIKIFEEDKVNEEVVSAIVLLAKAAIEQEDFLSDYL